MNLKIFEPLDPSINMTFIIHACFSGAMFSCCNNPRGMKGIALASVGPKIPSVVRKEADTRDFTIYILDKVIKKLLLIVQLMAAGQRIDKYTMV